MTTTEGNANRFGGTASTTSRKTFSPPQMELLGALNRAVVVDPIFKGVHIDTEIPLPRDEHRANGNQLAYYPDIALRDTRSGLRYALEVMGEGSKSDDPVRHQWLLEHGYLPLYFENSEVRHAMHLVMRRIRQTVQMMRVLFS